MSISDTVIIKYYLLRIGKITQNGNKYFSLPKIHFYIHEKHIVYFFLFLVGIVTYKARKKMSGAAIASGIGVVANVVGVGLGLFGIFGPNYGGYIYKYIHIKMYFISLF